MRCTKASGSLASLARKAGKKSGKGDYFFCNGDQYSGHWANNERHGEGTIVFEDFTKWVGLWKAGKRHGNGIFTDQDGKMYTEEYRNGNLVERKYIETNNDMPQTLMTHTSVETDSSLNEFLESMRQDDDMSRSGRDRVNIKGWSTEAVIRWLDYLNMQQYADIFRENRMEGISLLNLKEKDLLDMGITSKGHRMILREAIEHLRKKIQPVKEKRISIHKDHKRKKQAYSLSSEMKLREYYKTVEMIEEEADSNVSEVESNKIKSTSAKINMSSKVRSIGSDEVGIGKTVSATVWRWTGVSINSVARLQPLQRSSSCRNTN